MTSERTQSDATLEAKEDKPRTPFTAAAIVVRQIQLKTIQFSSYAAQRLTNPPDGAALSATTSFIRPVVTQHDGGFVVVTSLLFNTSVSGQGDALSASVSVIRASIDTEYTFNADAPAFSEEDLADFALCYGPFHAWGYWREFIQSSLARLNLPQITVPLFLISQAPTMVINQD